MIIGIVGPEQSKWTPEGEAAARWWIRELIRNVAGVSSGACHLGGVDIWAREEANIAGISLAEFPPKDHGWYWYKQRNIYIAKLSDKVVCLTPYSYPDGRRSICKHCGTTHVSSGGCWTVKYAASIGKESGVIVIGA